MSKITFRADEELVERIEDLDASKSEVMREALREYLDDRAGRESERTGDAGASERTGDAGASDAGAASDDSLDAALARRVDELVAERLAAREARAPANPGAGGAQDVNVNVTLETDAAVRASDAGRAGGDARPRDDRRASDDPHASDDRNTRRSGARRSADRGDDPASDTAGRPTEESRTCGQCGESLSDDHVYCPNCGEKASRRVFCECGDEVRSDWGFCPSCGRRTAAADVLDRS